MALPGMVVGFVGRRVVFGGIRALFRGGGSGRPTPPPPPNMRMRTKGLSDLRRALRRVDGAADEAIERRLRELADDVAVKARARTPVLTGKLQKSIKTSVTVRRGAAVVSNVPYSKVHEWGGVIRPRGVPITIPRSAMITGAAESSDAAIARAIDKIGDDIERAWGR